MDDFNDHFEEFELDFEESTHSEIIKAQYRRILENSLPQFVLYTQNDMIMGRNWRWNIISTPNFIFVNMWMNLTQVIFYYRSLPPPDQTFEMVGFRLDKHWCMTSFCILVGISFDSSMISNYMRHSQY